MSEANSNSPDTFCPAGWQLPLSGNATTTTNKSWSKLFSTYGYGDNQDGINGIVSYPIAYVYSGTYNLDIGRLYYLGVRGTYWSNTIGGTKAAYRMAISPSERIPDAQNGMNGGYTLRCVNRN